MVFRILLIFSLFTSCFSLVYAAPNGGSVVAGSATISQNNSNTNVFQQTDKAIINWNNFSIGKNENVNFIQPNVSSVTLNRVVGNLPSNILGNLTANGNIFLVNQNGILIGNGASIQVGSFLGSTANISNSDFLNNNYLFKDATGIVINDGIINAKNGTVTILANNITNNGEINAKNGNVFLATGNTFRLNYDRLGLVGISVDGGSLNSNISNNGSINGKNINITAKSSDLLKSNVNNAGIINASSVKTEGGKVVLVADNINNSGSIDVSGKIGGNILIDSNNSTNINNGSIIKANGEDKAGEIKVLSKGSTIVNKNSLLEATSIYGNGGFIETSGKIISVYGKVDTSSKYGNKGKYLIDPSDIIIMKDAPSGALEENFQIPENQEVSYIDMDYLNTQLANNNIEISTVGTIGNRNGDITIFGGVGSIITGQGLSLNAAGNINIFNEEINLTGSLGLTANGSIVSNAKLSASEIRATSTNSFIDILNINNVSNVYAVSNDNINLSSIGSLNLAEVKGKNVFLKSETDINGKGVVAERVSISSANATSLTLNTPHLNASSSNGAITINNEHTNVSLGTIKTNNNDITYTQDSGITNINQDISAGSGMINITNKAGNVYGSYDFVADTTKNMLIKANEIYLTKTDEADAVMSQEFVDHVEPTKFVDIKIVGGLNLTSDVNKNIDVRITSENGGINSNGNRVTLKNLNINTKSDINLITDLETGSIISREGNINLSENNDVTLSQLSASNGSVTLNIENQGNLKVFGFESLNNSKITTVDNVNIDIEGTNRDLTVDVLNGISETISFVNGGSIDFTSLNTNGTNNLSIISKNGNLKFPFTSLSSIEKLNLEANIVNDGSEFSLTSKNIILNIRDKGVFKVDSENIDISAGVLNILSDKDINIIDLNDNGYSLFGNSIFIDTNNKVTLEDIALINNLKILSSEFVFGSKNNGYILGSSVDLRSDKDISGTGRIVAGYLYLQGVNIGLDSNIYVDADDAIFSAFGGVDWSKINIVAPSYFKGLLRYQFLTSGDVFINGLPVDKGMYYLMNDAYKYSFYPYEDNNIGIASIFAVKNHNKEKENLVEVEEINIPNADKSQIR